MNTIPNRAAICEVLLKEGRKDRDIIVLCSDSRGSASLSAFALALPEQFIEVGIAEQNLVSVAAGLAKCGKKVFAASPACFLTTRSIEQAKVDVAYSGTNVTLIGISGGVSYGALGMTHHSAQDIAMMGSIPGMRVYLPSDRFQTGYLISRLLQDEAPAYVRVGRNPVEDIYTEETDFTLGKAVRVAEGRDLTVIACGEMVSPALKAAKLLEEEGIRIRVLDMYSVKPMDEEAVLCAAEETGGIITVEEHTCLGGLGARVSQITAQTRPVRVNSMALPDSPVVTGNSQEVFAHYGLDAEGIAQTARRMLAEV